MEREEIKINRASLQEAIREAVVKASNCSMSGWGVAIYVDPEGNCSSGSLISQSTSTRDPDLFELHRVRAGWDEEEDSDSDIEEMVFYVEERILDEIEGNSFKIEWVE